jgi:hypothetical protein
MHDITMVPLQRLPDLNPSMEENVQKLASTLFFVPRSSYYKIHVITVGQNQWIW